MYVYFIYKIENLYSLEMILKINIRIDALVYFLSKSFFEQDYIVMKSFLWFDCTFTKLPGLVYDAAVQGCISSNLFKVLSFIQ